MKKVLLVDDLPDALAIVQAAVQAAFAGAQCTLARGAHEALRLVEAQPFDLALVDLAATYGGNELGLVVGRADLIAACALQQLGLGRLFRPDAAAMAAAVAAVRATAADPAAGLAQADL